MFPKPGALVGSVVGRTMLAVNGRVSVGGDGTEVLTGRPVVMFVELSQAV